MPSLGSLLQIGKGALGAQQNAMNVIAHNIANASTEGYSRQRPVLEAATPLNTPQGVFGTGVSTQSVQRIRDDLLDGVYYREAGTAAQHETRSEVMTRIEEMLGEPSNVGLAAAMDALYSSWSDLASNPASPTTRTAVQQAGQLLSQKFHDIAANLDQIRQEVDTRMVTAVDRVNALAADIAEINGRIVATEAGGGTAGDLRDRRTKALIELGQLMPIQVNERGSGDIGVTTSGFSIIDGVYSTPVEIRTVAGTTGIAVVGRPVLLTENGGKIGGLLSVLNTDHPDVVNRIDQLASSIVSEVNAVHQTGTNAMGNTGVDFFDPTQTTAGSIQLSAAVSADSDEVAAGTPDGTGGYRAGANDVALAIGTLRDTTIVALGTTMNQHYQGVVSDVGQVVRSSTQAAEVQRTLAEQADVRRMSYSGVSIDEELVKLIEFQTAYQASARVVSAADEIIQSLLSI